jgi:hypothetical protein
MAYEYLWTESLEELALWCGIKAQPDSPTARVAETVLGARLALTQASALEATTKAARSTARATWVLVLATWALAIASIVVLVVS